MEETIPSKRADWLPGAVDDHDPSEFPDIPVKR
jgi:hypothetical protein